MTITTQEAPYIGGGTCWGFDDTSGDQVPTAGNAPIDMTRGMGRMTTVPVGGGAAALSRALANNFLPVGLAIVDGTNGPEINTTTTRTAMCGGMQNTFNFGGGAGVGGTFPAGSLNLVGRTLRFHCSGNMGCTSTPNLTLDISFGATGSLVMATTGVLALATATTPAPWVMDVYATVQSTGSTATIISEGIFQYSTTSSVLVIPWTMGNTTRGVPLTLDLTVAQSVMVYATFGTSNALNRIIMNICTCEILY